MKWKADRFVIDMGIEKFTAIANSVMEALNTVRREGHQAIPFKETEGRNLSEEVYLWVKTNWLAL
jgi:hypothetical protein